MNRLLTNRMDRVVRIVAFNTSTTHDNTHDFEPMYRLQSLRKTRSTSDSDIWWFIMIIT